MEMTELTQPTEAYIREVSAQLAGVSAACRRRLVADLRSDLAAAVADKSPEEVHEILSSFGDPKVTAYNLKSAAPFSQNRPVYLMWLALAAVIVVAVTVIMASTIAQDNHGVPDESPSIVVTTGNR